LPGVDIDLAELRRDHDNRTRWRTRTLHQPPQTDWDAVRYGARRLLGDTAQTRTPTA